MPTAAVPIRVVQITDLHLKTQPGSRLWGADVDGSLNAVLAHIHLPERCANVCFGGRHRNRLFMAASRSLYALFVNTQGAV